MARNTVTPRQPGRSFAPGTYKRASWRRAATLIEQSRRHRAPNFDPATFGLAQVLQMMRISAEVILASGEYEEHPAGLPARMARGMLAITEEIIDHGLEDTDIVAELVQELVAHVFEAGVDCARSGTLPAQLAGAPRLRTGYVRGYACRLLMWNSCRISGLG